MDYNLTVVILLIIYFIFLYETVTAVNQYCMADNQYDRKNASYAIMGSACLTMLFAVWAWYEYRTNKNTVVNILVTLNKERKIQAKEDFKNAPDPNIKSALDRNGDKTTSEPTSDSKPEPMYWFWRNDEEIDKLRTTSEPKPTPYSEYDKYETVNADSSYGDITREYRT